MRRQLQAMPHPKRKQRPHLQLHRSKRPQVAVLKAAEGLRAALERPAKVSSTPPRTVHKGSNAGIQHGQHGQHGSAEGAG